MQDRFIIELRNKTTLWVSDSQATVIDEAWQNKATVRIGKSHINTVDIVGIWDESTWYNNHPDERQVQRDDTKLPPVISQVERSKPSIWRDCVMKNAELLKSGELPKYTVIDGEIVEKEYYWR